MKTSNIPTETLRLAVPPRFTEMLRRTSLTAYASVMMDILKWATEHSAEAELVAEQVERMRGEEKDLFVRRLEGYRYSSCFNDIQQIVRDTLFTVAFRRRHRSLVGKVAYAARHGGYKFEFAEREGTVVAGQNEYILVLPVGSSQVRVVYSRRNFTCDLEQIFKHALLGKTRYSGVRRIEYLATKYASGRAIKKILNAVELNLQPEIAAVILEEK